MISLVEVSQRKEKEKRKTMKRGQGKPVTINPSMMRCVSAHIVQSLFLSLQKFQVQLKTKKGERGKRKRTRKDKRNGKEKGNGI